MQATIPLYVRVQEHKRIIIISSKQTCFVAENLSSANVQCQLIFACVHAENSRKRERRSMSLIVR